jgi:molecular chaperone GrpE
METEATHTADGADAAAAADTTRPPTEDPDARLAEANARADENHAKLLYALADFENYKKRNERFLSERLSAGKRSILGRFLPVLDNLERALASGADGGALRDGLQATLRGFEALLAAEDVKPIGVLGEAFDPRVAEAIGTKDRDDLDDNTVIEEVQRGYTLADEVLRPARVIVSKRPAATSNDEAEAAPY